jgi:hypothetical protein
MAEKQQVNHSQTGDFPCSNVRFGCLEDSMNFHGDSGVSMGPRKGCPQHVQRLGPAAKTFILYPSHITCIAEVFDHI